MDERFKKREDETENEYKGRLYRDKISLGLSNIEINEIICKELNVKLAESTTRCNASIWNDGYDCGYEKALKQSSNDTALIELDDKKRELEKERKKIQTLNIEYNRNLREQARKELIEEFVTDAINNLESLNIPKPIKITEGKKEGILPIADPHYGKKCEILGLKGEILNEYNSDVFERRMYDLLNRVISISQKEGIEKLNITLQGDLIDGILRMSQLTKLQYGIIDSTIKFAEYIANWINELSHYVYCDIYYTLGNHSQVRPLGSKNGEFADENMEKIIIWHIKSRLENNPNVKVNDNNSDFIFFNCLGINVMGSHGEEKNLEQAVKDYKMIYGEDIHLFITGHLHSKETKSIGINGDLSDIETIRVKSICGIDDFSMTLRRSASAGATYLVIEEGLGKTIEYDIKLK